MKRTNVLWITGLVLGWFFDFLFWKANAGINFAIYVALCLAGGLLVLSLNSIKPSWKSLILLIPILFFASMTFIRQEPLSLFLSFVLTLGLMGVLAVTFLGGRWTWYSLSDYVVNAFRLIGSMIARPISFRSERQKQAAAEGLVGAATDSSEEGQEAFLGDLPRGRDCAAHHRPFCHAALLCRPGLCPAVAGFHQIIPTGEIAGIHLPRGIHPHWRVRSGGCDSACGSKKPGRETGKHG